MRLLFFRISVKVPVEGEARPKGSNAHLLNSVITLSVLLDMTISSGVRFVSQNLYYKTIFANIVLYGDKYKTIIAADY